MRITIIGSGNVATHLAAALKNAGHYIVQIYSRNYSNAALLAYHVKAQPVDNIDNLNAETDMFIVSVKDDVIDQIAGQLARHQKLIIHTAGATPLQTLLDHTLQAGVFYPLQTFSKVREVNFATVPLCIEGANENIEQLLLELASTISQSVYKVDSHQRRILHLAAVFACNFPNFLYHTAQNLLAQNQLPFDLIRPLILETAEKVQQQLPNQVQTGPALRRDEKTMQAHLGLLDGNEQLKQIYELLSQAIIKMDTGLQGIG